MGRARALSGVVVAVVAAVVLGGCTDPGGGAAAPSTSATSQAPPSAEEQVVAVLTELGTSTDPDQCTDSYTARGLEVAVGSTDPAVCRRAVIASEPADEVVVDQVVVDGGTATARVTAIGGASAGLAQTLDLVQQEDRWKVDGVAGLAIADRAAFDEHITSDLRAWGPEVLPPETLPCIDERLRAVPDAEIVAAYLEGRSHEAAVGSISWCLAAGVDSVALYQIVLHQLRTKGLTEEQASCVAVEALGTFLDLTLEQLVTSQAARAHLEDGLLRASETQVCQELGAAP
jgi:hypothetical protein